MIISGNVDELKAYRLIPLTHPLFFHFTLPLRNEQKKKGVLGDTGDKDDDYQRGMKKKQGKKLI